MLAQETRGLVADPIETAALRELMALPETAVGDPVTYAPEAEGAFLALGLILGSPKEPKGPKGPKRK
ncbi:hypothetical protein ACFP1Z_26780 [Streptomyces gamaensis]|uniref:Uncharacterized protein n=1 Tax=Streptomyces gamaensis TaxID=1763542 RepID=A0ABW0ZB10_9ACTN